MTSKHGVWVALIRAIGPLTHKKMSMAQLRLGCSDAGLRDVRTVLATGNAIFSSDLPEADVRRIMRSVITAHSLDNEVFLRRPDDLAQILATNPIPDAALERPNHMLVLFMAETPSPSEIAAVESFEGPETVKVIGREAYIDYRNGVEGSKLTPGRLEKLLGRSGTARNWNTIAKLLDQASK